MMLPCIKLWRKNRIRTQTTYNATEIHGQLYSCQVEAAVKHGLCWAGAGACKPDIPTFSALPMAPREERDPSPVVGSRRSRQTTRKRTQSEYVSSDEEEEDKEEEESKDEDGLSEKSGDEGTSKYTGCVCFALVHHID